MNSKKKNTIFSVRFEELTKLKNYLFPHQYSNSFLSLERLDSKKFEPLQIILGNYLRFPKFCFYQYFLSLPQR